MHSPNHPLGRRSHSHSARLTALQRGLQSAGGDCGAVAAAALADFCAVYVIALMPV